MRNWRHVTGLGWGGDVNVHVNLRRMHNWRHVTGLGWGGDVNVHVNLRHMHNWRHVTGLGWGGDVNVHVNLRHMHNWRHVTGLGRGGDVNVHVNLRHMHNWRHVTGLGRGGDVNVHVRLLDKIKAFMYRHNSGHNLWKELGKLAKKSRRWTTCKGELKNEFCWMTGDQMWLNLSNRRKKTIILFRGVENRWTFHTKRAFGSWPQCNYDLTFLSHFYKTLQIPWFGERSIMKNPWVTQGR